MGRDTFQEVDIVGVTMPITKHNYFVKDVNNLADTLREAFEIAQSGRPGPVLVDITKDVQQAVCDYTPKPAVVPKAPVAPAKAELDKALEYIRKSQRPYIYFGGGVISGQAEKELISLADKIDAPMGSSLMGLSAVPTDHPRFLGMQGMHGHFASSKALAEADLILAVGVRFSDRATGNKDKYSENKTIIHIDVDAAEINKNISADFGIEGDVKTSLKYFNDNLSEIKHTEWMKTVAMFVDKEKSFASGDNALTPYSVIDAVNSAMDDDAIVVTDVGQHQMWAAQRVFLRKPRTFLSSGGLGTMGYGLGAAIGAAIGTGKRTVLYTGDGCFSMNLNELSTVVSNNVPIVIVLMNNGVLGMVRQWQNKIYNKRFSNTTLHRFIDYEKLLAAFGGKAYNVTSRAELDDAVKKAFSENTVTLLNCMIDKDEFVLPFIPSGGSVDEMILTKEGQ